MRKLFAVIKREYIQRVRTKFFVVATILGPLLMAGFTVVPALMLGMKSGGPTRLAIVDQTGRMYGRVAHELESNQMGDDDENQSPTPVQPAVGPAASQERMKQAGQMVKGSYVVEEARLGNKSLDQLTGSHSLQESVRPQLLFSTPQGSVVTWTRHRPLVESSTEPARSRPPVRRWEVPIPAASTKCWRA